MLWWVLRVQWALLVFVGLVDLLDVVDLLAFVGLVGPVGLVDLVCPIRPFKKIAIYCPQGSGTLRQQLLIMH